MTNRHLRSDQRFTERERKLIYEAIKRLDDAEDAPGDAEEHEELVEKVTSWYFAAW